MRCGSVRFDSVRFDSVRCDSVRFDSITFTWRARPAHRHTTRAYACTIRDLNDARASRHECVSTLASRHRERVSLTRDARNTVVESICCERAARKGSSVRLRRRERRAATRGDGASPLRVTATVGWRRCEITADGPRRAEACRAAAARCGATRAVTPCEYHAM